MYSFVDTYKYKGMRKRLAEVLKGKGIQDVRLLNVIANIPRHYFLESAFAEKAYDDNAFPIGEGQTISQPFTVAYQTQLLNEIRGQKVLEIGTGSGYQCSILCALGAQVYSIERIASLSEQAGKTLAHLDFYPTLLVGDGTLGAPQFAPFDKILVTAASPKVPDSLVDQLTIGGTLVIPVGDMNSQKMIRVTNHGRRNTSMEVFEDFKFVPLIGAQGW